MDFFINVSVLIDEGLDSSFQGLVWVELATNRFTSEWVSLAVVLNMLLNGCLFVGLPSISHHWVFHEIQRNLAAVVVGNL